MNLQSILKELGDKVDALPLHPDVCAVCIASDGKAVSAMLNGSPRQVVQLLVSMADQHENFSKILRVAAALAKADEQEKQEEMHVIRTSGPKKGKEYLN